MKFTCTIDIKSDMDTIIAAFFNTEDMKHYQDGFQSKTLLSGIEGQEGAKSRLVFDKLELIETIKRNNLPDEFLALYEHKHTTNTMKVNFKPLPNGIVRYTSIVEYTELRGFIIKMLAKLFPSMFKKQIDKWLKLFKIRVEDK